MNGSNLDKKKNERVRVHVSTILMSVFVILFVLGVIFAYYAMLYSETRERIINNGEMNSMSTAQQIDKYLSTGVDTMKLMSYTLDSMIRAGKTNAEIKEYIVNQTSAIKNIQSLNSNGFYAYINHSYLGPPA